MPHGYSEAARRAVRRYAVLGNLFDALAAARAQRCAFCKQDIGEPVDAFEVQRMAGKRQARRHEPVVDLELTACSASEPGDCTDCVVGMRLEVEQQAHRVTLCGNLRVAGAIHVCDLGELTVRTAWTRKRRLVKAAVAAVGVGKGQCREHGDGLEIGGHATCKVSCRRKRVGHCRVHWGAIGKAQFQPRELHASRGERFFVDLDAERAPRIGKRDGCDLLHREAGPSVLLLEVLLGEDEALMPERFVDPHGLLFIWL